MIKYKDCYKTMCHYLSSINFGDDIFDVFHQIFESKSTQCPKNIHMSSIVTINVIV